MEKDRKDIPWLRWPWNLIIYVLLAVLLRILAIPIILLLMRYQRKTQPGGPQEGYCLQRTRRGLIRLVWAALFLLISAACGVTFFTQLTGSHSSWEATDYVTLAVAGVIAAGALACGVYEGFTALRDAFAPEKSRLAKSIRSQLPYPDEAPAAVELFRMVDKDIQENGVWFDRVAVGKEWVLGDDASYIPRIRAVFGRDEVKVGHSKKRTHTTRIIQLYILDDRRQVQTTALRNPNELQSLLECLKQRAPEALFLPYSQYLDICGKSADEWERLLQDYEYRKSQREIKDLSQRPQKAYQEMVLTLSDGTVTSRLSPELLVKTLDCTLAQEGLGAFFLTPSRPLQLENHTFTQLECLTGYFEEDRAKIYLLLKDAPPSADMPSQRGMALTADRKQAAEILHGWLLGCVPALDTWEPINLYYPYRREKQLANIPPRLTLISSQGVRQSHETFTLEDVQIAADGLVDGSYKTVDIALTGGYLWMRAEAGDKMDGRCKISVTQPDPDKLRYFTNSCTHRQAAAWLLEFCQGNFRPVGSEWKDRTQQMEKAVKKAKA